MCGSCPWGSGGRMAKMVMEKRKTTARGGGSRWRTLHLLLDLHGSPTTRLHSWLVALALAHLTLTEAEVQTGHRLRHVTQTHSPEVVEVWIPIP